MPSSVASSAASGEAYNPGTAHTIFVVYTSTAGYLYNHNSSSYIYVAGGAHTSIIGAGGTSAFDITATLTGAWKLVAQKYSSTHATHVLRANGADGTRAGVGYGVGMAFGPEEEDFDYFHDAALAMFTVYFQLVEKRKDMTPSPEQVNQMFRQRAEWIRFNFMENRFFLGGMQFGAPPESFMLHNLPPVVKF